MRVKALWFGILIFLSSSSLIAQELIDRIEEQFSGIETISIKGAFCQTKIVSGADAEVSLEGEIRSVRRYQDLRIRYTQTGSQLDVWIEQPRNTMGTGQIRGVLLLSIPVQTRVIVSNLSGSVTADGLGSSTTTLETISGDVMVKNVFGALNVRTISGSINGGLVGGDVNANTVSGNITMKDVRGGCHLSSTSGNIRVSSVFSGAHLSAISGNVYLSDVIGSVEVKSVSGEIVASRLKGSMVASSSSGAIRVEGVVGILDLNSISGSIKGEQLLLTADSSFKNASGDIDIMLSNDAETLSFNLKSLSGRLDVYGLISEKQMIEGDGSVRVMGVTTSGNQRYR